MASSITYWERGAKHWRRAAKLTEGEQPNLLRESSQTYWGRAAKLTEGEQPNLQRESSQTYKGRAAKLTEGEQPNLPRESSQIYRGRAAKSTEGEQPNLPRESSQTYRVRAAKLTEGEQPNLLREQQSRLYKCKHLVLEVLLSTAQHYYIIALIHVTAKYVAWPCWTSIDHIILLTYNLNIYHLLTSLSKWVALTYIVWKS